MYIPIFIFKHANQGTMDPPVVLNVVFQTMVSSVKKNVNVSKRDVITLKDAKKLIQVSLSLSLFPLSLSLSLSLSLYHRSSPESRAYMNCSLSYDLKYFFCFSVFKAYCCLSVGLKVFKVKCFCKVHEVFLECLHCFNL